VATADPAEVAFFDGLIALRGEDDPEAATEAFDRFLELAPDDPRAEMVRRLRDEAGG
jgi:regulator of sirC expression with transglutaminase-like and TPR domain